MNRVAYSRCSTLLVAIAASALLVGTVPGRGAVKPAARSPLEWDAMSKAYHAHPGDSVAEIAFQAHNPTGHEVVVERVQPSCGCTIVEMPSHPWRIPPGATSTLRVKIDLIGKVGEFEKTIMIYAEEGPPQTLEVNLSIPPMTAAQRQANRRAAERNRQVVFQGDCARCHATPAVDKEGGELFRAVCAVCHVSPHQASMVPNLARPTTHRDPAFWHGLIAEGRPGTLMPAFSRARGGPLTDVQIVSLVDFLMKNFPTDPVPPGR